MSKQNIVRKVHFYLNKFPILWRSLRLLSYIRNNLFRASFEKLIVKNMVKGWQKMKILDLGCGPCYKERSSLFRHLDITGVDIYKPNLDICQKYGVKTLEADIREIDKYFNEKSVDIVWMFDVIEHLRKKDALRLLNIVEQIARKQVIIFTPVGYLPQDNYEDGNMFQKHLSEWSREDFEKRGYRCKVLRNFHRDIRKYSKRFANEKFPIPADAIWAIKFF